MDDAKEITFFRTKKRGKGYRESDKSRRRLLVALLSEGKQLTVRKLAFRAKVSYSSTYDILPELIKFGVVKSLPVAKRKHRQDFAYALTNEGLALALVIAWEERIVGVDYPVLLQQVFQPNPKDDPITILASYVILNAVNRGLTSYALRFIFAGVSARENGEETDWRKAALGSIEATKEEAKAIRECYLAAFDNLTETDRDAAYQYYKGEAEHTLLKIAQRGHNRPLMMLTLESQKDPDYLIMPFNCGRCPYQTKRTELSMSKVLEDAFIKGGLSCPRCGRVTKAKHKTAEKLAALAISVIA